MSKRITSAGVLATLGVAAYGVHAYWVDIAINQIEQKTVEWVDMANTRWSELQYLGRERTGSELKQQFALILTDFDGDETAVRFDHIAKVGLFAHQGVGEFVLVQEEMADSESVASYVWQQSYASQLIGDTHRTLEPQFEASGRFFVSTPEQSDPFSVQFDVTGKGNEIEGHVVLPRLKLEQPQLHLEWQEIGLSFSVDNLAEDLEFGFFVEQLNLDYSEQDNPVKLALGQVSFQNRFSLGDRRNADFVNDWQVKGLSFDTVYNQAESLSFGVLTEFKEIDLELLEQAARMDDRGDKRRAVIERALLNGFDVAAEVSLNESQFNGFAKLQEVAADQAMSAKERSHLLNQNFTAGYEVTLQPELIESLNLPFDAFKPYFILDENGYRSQASIEKGRIAMNVQE